jgi:hypothetical protein
MSTKEINIKTVIAVILLIVDVLAICGFVYCRIDNELAHYGILINKSNDMQLTLNKDITETYHDKTVTVPAGTVVEAGHISLDRVHFYYLDEWSLSASYEDFKEKDQLEDMKQKAVQEYNADRERVIKQSIGPGIAIILCGLLIGSLITFFLVKIEWYLLLYVLDILFIFVLYFVLSLTLCH